MVLLVLFFLLLAGGGYLLWWLQPQTIMPDASRALAGSASVTVVETKQFLHFQPANNPAEVGIIFYPGGLVPSAAYAPFGLALAEVGFPTWLAKMPLHLAVLAADRASDIRTAHPEIQQWLLVGHSLGGAMAAQYVVEHPSTVVGLVLLAAYPAANKPLTESALPVLAISASEDGLADPATIAATASRLPEQTIFLEIQGGNHSQFGWYGFQDGDKPAAIPRAHQQEQVLAAIHRFIDTFVAAEQTIPTSP